MSRELYEKIFDKYKSTVLNIHEQDTSLYQCVGCGWIYRPKEQNGMPFSEWSGPCPQCGAPKNEFTKMINELLSQLPVDFKDASPEERDIQILRAGMIAELDAVNFYEQMAQQTQNEKVKKVLLDVAFEEKVHAEEFQNVLEDLDPEYEKAEDQAEEEAEDMGVKESYRRLIKAFNK